MELLIDGHNLIHALPGIDLADPDDEARLVERLRAYCGRTRRRASVFFDRGLPGGPSRELSTGQVKVIFAPQNSSADALIIKRIQRATDRGQYLVISSDREIIAAAKARGLETMTSAGFVEKLTATMRSSSGVAETDGIPDDVSLPPGEVEWWERFFNRPRGE